MARTVLMPTARMSVLLPDMLEPLMRRTLVSPQTLTSLRTHFAVGNEGMAKLLGVEAGRAFDELGEWIGGVLVAVAGEGEERFGFAGGFQPGADRGSVGGAPGFGGVGGLDYVHERNVEAAHEGIFERADVFDDGSQAGDGLGAGEVVGGELGFEGLQARGFELFALQTGEKRREKLEIFQSVIGCVKNCGGAFAERRSDDGFNDNDGEERGLCSELRPDDGCGDCRNGEQEREPAQPRTR